MQNELTLAIDKSYNYINSVEQGKIAPSFDVSQSICEVLEIKAAWFFDEDASPENVKTFSKEEYISGISDKLFEKLKKKHPFRNSKLFEVKLSLGDFFV